VVCQTDNVYVQIKENYLENEGKVAYSEGFFTFAGDYFPVFLFLQG